MTASDIVLLIVGGAFAGVINTMAGGGSTLTVPLLVLAGVPGTVANGSNRVGILTSNMAAVAGFRSAGIGGLADWKRILLPVVAGSVIGASAISRLANDTFETVFGLLMIPVIVLTIVRPKSSEAPAAWPPWVTVAVFFAVGLYGGAFQAGVGLVLIAALSRAGFDLVTANSMKVAINVAVTAIALPIFILSDKVDWAPALVLAAGFTAGGWLGAKWTVKGGQRLVRGVMLVAAFVLAGRLLGLWG